MILLYLGSEIRRSNPWRNHYNAVTAVRDVRLVDFEKEQPSLDGEIVINIGNHLYYPEKDLLADRLRGCEYLIYINDDYTGSLPTQMRRAIANKPNWLISHVKDVVAKRGHLLSWSWVSKYVYAPMNYASWKPLAPRPFQRKGLLYYGSARPGRMHIIGKYLCTQLYETWLSCSPRARKKFAEEGILCKEVDKLTIPDELQNYQASLYIEDEAHYAWDPGNRFFECLSAGIAIIFAKETLASIQRNGYRVDDYVASCDEDVARLLLRSEEIRHEQRRLWARDYLAELYQRLDEVLPK